MEAHEEMLEFPVRRNKPEIDQNDLVFVFY